MIVVCATDLSERAVAGEMAAAALSERGKATVLWLVYVVPEDLATIDRDATRVLVERARQSLEEHAAALRQRAPTVVRCTVLNDRTGSSAAEALLAFAEGQQASLLVLASQGHGASPLRRVGGTSERAAQLARLPVLVVRDATPFEAWRNGERPLRVLLGIDRSTTSEFAIRWVKELRSMAPCDVLVTHVYYPDEKASLYGLHGVPVTTVEASVEQRVARDLERQVGTLPGSGRVLYQPKVGIGRLGDHLLEVAESNEVDLIVVGTRGKRGLARLASVSSVVMHFGHASIACIPEPEGTPARSEELPKLERILIATDFSAPSNRAIAYGYALASERRSEVHLLHVVEPGNGPGDAEVIAKLRQLVPPAAGHVATRTEVVRSTDVARAICTTAERVGADAICLASHGRSGLRRAVLGSVAEAVMRHSLHPVLVVRPPP